MKTPREILEELCHNTMGNPPYRIDQALSALRECVLAKKITKPCPYSDIKCCTMQDYSKNQVLQDIANLFGGEK